MKEDLKNKYYQRIAKSYKVKMAQQYVERVASKVGLLLEFVCANLSQAFKALPSTEKKILFIFDDEQQFVDDDRYIYLILRAFSEAGYAVYFYKKITFSKFMRSRKWTRRIYRLKNLKLISELPSRTEDMICAFDTVYKDILALPSKKFTYLNLLKPTFCKAGGVVTIPYFLHPRMYQARLDKKVGDYRKKERSLRIFFGGNMNKAYYTNPNITKHGKLTRFEAVETLLQKGSQVKFWKEARKFDEFVSTLKTYVNECHLVETDHTFPMSPEKWFSILASSDFFLCFSGTDKPMCHNALESMAVGTIPIIGYADWFFPALEHGKNAIVYSGKEDLVKKVKEVLDMSPQAIARMRQNVIEYYEQYLTNASFIKRYESADSKINTIMLHERLICTAAEDDKGREILKALEDVMKTNRISNTSKISLQNIGDKASPGLEIFHGDKQ